MGGLLTLGHSLLKKVCVQNAQVLLQLDLFCLSNSRFLPGEKTKSRTLPACSKKYNRTKNWTQKVFPGSELSQKRNMKKQCPVSCWVTTDWHERRKKTKLRSKAIQVLWAKLPCRSGIQQNRVISIGVNVNVLVDMKTSLWRLGLEPVVLGNHKILLHAVHHTSLSSVGYHS